MKIKVTLEHNGIMPAKEHWNDAGLELYAPVDFFVGPFQRFTLWTGVMVEMPQDVVALIRSKNSQVRNKGLLTDGVIYGGYTGQIGITLINTTRKRVDFSRGDKVAQMLIVPTVYAEIERRDK